MSPAIPSAVDLLATCIPDFGATEIDRSPDELSVSVPVPFSDGRTRTYALKFFLLGRSASAREIIPSLLPSFCPMRHINTDGSFCLYWRAVDDILLSNREAALDWWKTMVRFLQMQTRAARLRRWPDGLARAHGSAAVNQFRAEEAAACLGEPFVSDMVDGRLSVTVTGSGA